jgi:7-cyano-7-deazaguanine synthase
VTAAIAAGSARELAFLHVSYGQRTEERERRAFHAIADHYGVGRRLVVDISYLREIGGSALTDCSIELPEGDVDRVGIPVSYVPFRNANLLAIATSWAEALGAGEIYIGAVEEDSSGYPDCRQVFFDAFSEVIRQGTRPDSRIEVVTPLIEWNKGTIVSQGMKLGAPLHLTWSCYTAEEKACGHCDSCLLRLRGFARAGLQDPIPYAEPV